MGDWFSTLNSTLVCVHPITVPNYDNIHPFSSSIGFEELFHLAPNSLNNWLAKVITYLAVVIVDTPNQPTFPWLCAFFSSNQSQFSRASVIVLFWDIWLEKSNPKSWRIRSDLLQPPVSFLPTMLYIWTWNSLFEDWFLEMVAYQNIPYLGNRKQIIMLVLVLT